MRDDLGRGGGGRRRCQGDVVNRSTMKIDLDELERIARAADKDNPGACYLADRVDGYPLARSAMDLFNAMDPATTLSLIRHIRELEALAGRGLDAMRSLEEEMRLQKGGTTATDEIDAGRAVLAKGATLYGSMDPVTDRWDIDRPR
jgi:hypothetical protein